MMLMISYMTMTLMLTMLMMLMMKMITKKSIIDLNKSSPFECGMNTISYKRLPFSSHFFLIAVIFLIFDIEIIMISPTIMTMKTSSPMMWMITSFSFITIIIMGLYYEWSNGLIKWSK
uniref:NADH-ubiquinone oxidoreductase chain 3 n=1 Tax=Olidiana tongmaiensis TaxID=2501809 RepID=A0A898PCL2_9HEMI|nr:NADH dehydrogenase subunit 3 [Olidiana tongmaiensis]QSJ61400.1 NADH dehydrogenase subunit 3 [Olidiana tongmaiensis]